MAFQQKEKNPERRRRFVFILLVALTITWLSLKSDAPITEVQNQAVAGASAQSPLATEALINLSVRESMSRVGYSRAQFSDDWNNVGGCDMRNLILQRDLSDVRLADDGCVVLNGVLTSDPYTSKMIVFERGPTTSNAVQIEHIVAVSDAWAKGAQSYDYERRNRFYNDPLNLIAVDGPQNIQKGDADASVWLPPNKSYRCRYIARQIAVKVKYALWVTVSELRAMKDVLKICPNQPLPIAE